MTTGQQSLIRRALLFVSITLAFVVLTGCGSSTPSEADAQKFYEQSGSLSYEPIRLDIKDGLAKVRSLHKTNGQAGERNGVKSYRFDYVVEIEYIMPAPAPNVHNHHVGDIVKDTGSIVFEQTEKGWEGVSWTGKGVIK